MCIYKGQHDKSIKANMTEVLKPPNPLSTHENKQNIKKKSVSLTLFLTIHLLFNLHLEFL